ERGTSDGRCLAEPRKAQADRQRCPEGEEAVQTAGSALLGKECSTQVEGSQPAHAREHGASDGEAKRVVAEGQKQERLTEQVTQGSKQRAPCTRDRKDRRIRAPGGREVD